MKFLLLIPLIIFCLFLLFFFWAAYPWRILPYEVKGDIFSEKTELNSNLNPTTLTVLSWNIAYGYGLGSEGVDYLPKTRSEYLKNLQQMANVIIDAKADIVLLQEVDFPSHRSHEIDQLKILSELTGLSYRASAVSWETNYIPFPYQPISSHFGRIKSGGGVLSRYPILENKVSFLEKPLNRPWWYKLFYLYRYFQVVNIKIHNKELSVLNLHLEAFDKETREDQTRDLVEKIKNNSNIFFVGGDFNTTPSNALKKSSFINSDDDYVNDKTYDLFLASGFKDVVEAVSYQQREDLYYTFPSNLPDRKLDYIFYRNNQVLISSEVIKNNTYNLSDHLPIKATFKLFDPEFIKD